MVDSTWRAGALPAEIFEQLPPNLPLTRRPLVVLVNAASASGAEVLAGALADNGRALLVGQTTFGKGAIQYFFPTGGDGSGVKARRCC